MIQLIADEREREVSEEGWTVEHDDDHEVGQLAMAAACYAAPEPIYSDAKYTEDGLEKIDAFPWEDKWDKRQKHSRMKQLTIAGALIIAEMERIYREEKYQESIMEMIKGDDDASSENSTD